MTTPVFNVSYHHSIRLGRYFDVEFSISPHTVPFFGMTTRISFVGRRGNLRWISLTVRERFLGWPEPPPTFPRRSDYERSNLGGIELEVVTRRGVRRWIKELPISTWRAKLRHQVQRWSEYPVVLN